MNKVGTVLLGGFLLTLFAGFGLGVVLGGPRAAQAESTYVDRLTDDYDLTPAQATKVRTILDEEERAITAVLEKLDAQVRTDVVAARKSAQESIRAALTESQRAQFDRDTKEEAAK